MIAGEDNSLLATFLPFLGGELVHLSSTGWQYPSRYSRTWWSTEKTGRVSYEKQNGFTHL